MLTRGYSLAAFLVFAFTLHAQTTTAPQGTFREWPLDAVGAYDPMETVDDAQGLTAQVSGPALVTAVGGAGDNGLLYWNPATNQFKRYGIVPNGFQVAVDVNRSTPSGGPPTFGGGDAWGAIRGYATYSPYVNFRGSNNFRSWPLSFRAMGVRWNVANAKVYVADTGRPELQTDPGSIMELDPSTNQYKVWQVGNRPWFLQVQGNLVYATAAAGGVYSDQILRLDITTNSLTRWTVPGGGFQTANAVGLFNFITQDSQGQLWFSLSATGRVGMLNPATNVMSLYSKSGIQCPSGMATTGVGPALQVFFNNSCSNNVADMVWALATPVTSVVVVPTVEAVVPSTGTVPPYDFTITPQTAVITPTTATTSGSDPSGIYLFPVPGPGFYPGGMSRVAFPQTVFGSLYGGNGAVYEFTSAAVVASEPGTVTGGGFIGVPDGSATFGFNVKQTQQNGPISGQLEYHNHATGEDVHSVAITSLFISGNTANFGGTCTNNGSPCTFNVTVQDNGEPGAGRDTFEIQGTVITPEGGTLEGGNIEIHPAQ